MVSSVQSQLSEGASLTGHAGTITGTCRRHQDPYLWSSPYGFGDEESDGESGLPEGEASQQARGPSLLLLDRAEFSLVNSLKGKQ